MEPDIIELENGDKYRITGFGAMTPEQQDQRRAQLDTQIRTAKVDKAATEWMHGNDVIAGREPGVGPDASLGGVRGKIKEGMDEFSRNYTGGLSDYVEAGASYLTPWLDTPLDELSFLERRDALRRSQDMEAERALPRGVDNAISLAGVLGMGSNIPGQIQKGWKAAAGTGAVIGGIEGGGHSEATDAKGVALDTALGSGIGAGVGGIADVFLDKVVGGGFRKAFGRTPENFDQAGNVIEGSSAAAAAALRELEIQPSVGAIGNSTAAGLENAMAEAPLVSSVGAMVDKLPGTGTSAAGVQRSQRASLNEALPNATAEMVPDNVITPGARTPSRPPEVTDLDSQFAPYVRNVARETDQRLRGEVKRMEGDFETLVPPMTPVTTRQTDAVPGNLRKEGNSATVFNAAQEEVDRIGQSPRKPVNATKHGDIQRQIGGVDAQIKAANKRITKLAPDDPEIGKLQKQVTRLGKQRDSLNVKLRAETGPTFKALRQDRSLVGKQTEYGGIGSIDDKAVYKAMTKDLETGAARVKGPSGRKKFRDMTKREREIFLEQDLVKPFTKTKNAASNVSAVKSALLRGNSDELDALTKNMSDSQLDEFAANSIRALGRNNADEPFNAKTFSDSWRKMDIGSKMKLARGNEEKLAVLEAIADVSESFVKRGQFSNTSSSASHAGVMAMLAGFVGNPDKIAPFLGTVIGVDRAVASKALAKAVAGETTHIGQLIRRAATNLSASPEGMELLYEKLEGVE